LQAFRGGCEKHLALRRLRSNKPNVRAPGGYFEPERFCILHADPGAGRYVLVLAIAHDDCDRENLPDRGDPQRGRGSSLAALAERMKGVIRLMGADFVMQPVAGSLACANDLAEGASYLPVISADLIPRQKPNDGSRNTVGSQSKILNANRTRPRPMPDRRFPPPWKVTTDALSVRFARCPQYPESRH
jgi:hypothetical protein